MPLRVEDRCVWVGDGRDRPVGSSGKVREVDGKRVRVAWGNGLVRWHDVGDEVVTCRQAANRGIEPWASAYGR